MKLNGRLEETRNSFLSICYGIISGQCFVYCRSASLWQWPASSRLQLSPRTFRVITLFVNWLVQCSNASLIGGSPCNRVLQKPTTCLYWSSFFLPENPASYHGPVAQAWPLEGPFHVEILVLLCCCLSRTPGETLLGLYLYNHVKSYPSL